jgi:polyisoprenoid-binding protein YceI
MSAYLVSEREFANVAVEPAKSTWAIDPAHTIVEFAVKHLMVSTVKGRFTGVSGTVELDEEDVTRSSVDVAIDVATINSHDETRDAQLRSGDFFAADQFPRISFKSTMVEPYGKDRLKVTGDLTIRGVTLPVTLDVEFNGRATSPWGAEVIAYSAQTTINRKDFGLTWNVVLEAGGVAVGDEVKISIEAEAIKQV